jgi:hypothetical protein
MNADLEPLVLRPGLLHGSLAGWQAKMVRARAESFAAGGDPDAYLWGLTGPAYPSVTSRRLICQSPSDRMSSSR